MSQFCEITSDPTHFYRYSLFEHNAKEVGGSEGAQGRDVDFIYVVHEFWLI